MLIYRGVVFGVRCPYQLAKKGLFQFLWHGLLPHRPPRWFLGPSGFSGKFLGKDVGWHAWHFTQQSQQDLFFSGFFELGEIEWFHQRYALVNRCLDHGNSFQPGHISRSTWMISWICFCADFVPWSINSRYESLRNRNINPMEGFIYTGSGFPFF